MPLEEVASQPFNRNDKEEIKAFKRDQAKTYDRTQFVEEPGVDEDQVVVKVFASHTIDPVAEITTRIDAEDMWNGLADAEKRLMFDSFKKTYKPADDSFTRYALHYKFERKELDRLYLVGVVTKITYFQ